MPLYITHLLPSVSLVTKADLGIIQALCRQFFLQITPNSSNASVKWD